MSEDEWMKRVRQVADLYGWLCYHTHRSDRSDPGFPDLVMVKGLRVLFVELKSEKGRVRPDQRRWLLTLHQAGAEVGLWRPSDQATMLRCLGPRAEQVELPPKLLAITT